MSDEQRRWSYLFYLANPPGIFDDAIKKATKYNLEHHLDFAEFVFETLGNPDASTLNSAQMLALVSEYLHSFVFIAEMASFSEFDDNPTEKDRQNAIKYRNQNLYTLSASLLRGCNQNPDINLWLKKDNNDQTKTCTLQVPSKLISVGPKLEDLYYAKEQPVILRKYQNTVSSYRSLRHFRSNNIVSSDSRLSMSRR